MPVDLRQLRCFLCVYAEGNVTRAARRLNLVQPAVSMQIRSLEEGLGLRLFERTTSGVVPTAAGHAVHALYSPVVSDLQQAEQRAMELNGKVLGKISMGVNRSVAHTVLGSALARYDALFPDVEVRIDEDTSEVLVDRASAGDLDFALVTPHRQRGRLIYDVIATEELFLVRRARGRTRRTATVSFAALAARRLIMPHSRHGFRAIIDQAAARLNVELTPLLEIDSFAPALDLVSMSDMSTIAPAISLSRYVGRLPLEIARISGAPMKRDIFCAYRRNRPLSTASRELVAIVRTELDVAIAKVAHYRGKGR